MNNLRLLDPMFSDNFETALRRMFSPTGLEREERQLQMRIDVSEKDDGYLVKADIPGVKKEDINIRIDGNVYRSTPRASRRRKPKTKAARCCAANATTALSRAPSAWARTWTTPRLRPGTPMAS